MSELLLGLFFIRAHGIYEEIVASRSIDSIVYDIRNDENFVEIESLPANYKNAVIAVEDHRFYEHGASDFIAIIRATVRNAQTKEFSEGGSTITQQVAKNMYFMDGAEKYSSAEKKIAELYIANELEKKYSKDEILELYVNSIYFGQSQYGIKEAANYYYDIEPQDMDLDQSSLLAGVPNAPSLYNPVDSEELARKRQKKVLSDMVEYGYISQSQMDEITNKHPVQ